MYQPVFLCDMKIPCPVKGHNLIIILLFAFPLIKTCPLLWNGKVAGTQRNALYNSSKKVCTSGTNKGRYTKTEQTGEREK